MIMMTIDIKNSQSARIKLKQTSSYLLPIAFSHNPVNFSKSLVKEKAGWADEARGAEDHRDKGGGGGGGGEIFG